MLNLPTGEEARGVWQFAFGFGAAFASAVIGRLMWHVTQVQQGTRRFWSLDLVWEFPLAVGMAIVGQGLAAWLGFGGKIEIGLIAALSYLGPRGAEALIAQWMSRRKGGS